MTKTKSINVCLHCEKTFEAGKKTAKYCSSKCRDFTVKSCEICGSDFNSRRQDKVTTCSDQCRATRNKWPMRGSQKQCEVCNKEFTVKHVRWSRTCGKTCAASLRIKEGTNSSLCIPATWQSRLKRSVRDINTRWRNHLVQCEQCGRNRATGKGRCKQCINRLSTASLMRIKIAVREWITRSVKQCRLCSNAARFQKHFCDSCNRQKKRDTHDSNHRQRCRRYGCEYHIGVNLKAIIARDGSKCNYCKNETIRWNGVVLPNTTTLDHVVPISKGGGHTMDNVVIACSDCNTRKSNKNTRLFGFP